MKEMKGSTIFFILLFGAIGLFLRPYVLTQIWLWFIVPLSVPQIDMPTAFGISLLVSWLVYQGAKTEESDYPVAKVFGLVVLVPLLMWGLGAIAHALQ